MDANCTGVWEGALCVAGYCYVPKNRYLAFLPVPDPPTIGNRCQAFEVTLASMKRCSEDLRETCSTDADCLNQEPPLGTCVEHPSAGTPLGYLSEPDENGVSRVVSDPVYLGSWPRWPETLYVADCEIVPVATYEIRATGDGIIFSDPLPVPTIRNPSSWHYGDTVGVGTGDLPPDPGYTPPNGIDNVNDISAYLLTKAGPTKPNVHSSWIDLHGLGDGCPPNAITNVSDLQRILFGVAGQRYEDTPDQIDPATCP